MPGRPNITRCDLFSMESHFTAVVKIGGDKNTISSTDCTISKADKETLHLEFKMKDDTKWKSNSIILSMEATASYRAKVFLSVSLSSEASVFRRTEEDETVWYVEQRTQTIKSIVRLFRFGSNYAPISRMLIIIPELDLKQIASSISGSRSKNSYKA